MEEREHDVVAVGELLVDMISTDRGSSLADSRAFVKASGGAVGNVAVGCARLGLETAFIGKVGDDPFGVFLRTFLEDSSVNTEGLIMSKEFQTPIVFVSLDEKSRPSFFFHGRPSADLQLRPDEIDEEVVRSSAILHFGTVTLSAEPARSATVKAVDMARSAGATISYDPNVRLHMWNNDRKLAVEWSLKMLEKSDVVKINDDEAELLFGTRDPKSAAGAILSKGPKLAVVTLGEKGAYYANAKASGHVAAPKVDVMDTTGAGDAFVSAMLAGLTIQKIAPEDKHVGEIVRRACVAASMTTESIGAVSAMPGSETLDMALRTRFK